MDRLIDIAFVPIPAWVEKLEPQKRQKVETTVENFLSELIDRIEGNPWSGYANGTLVTVDEIAQAVWMFATSIHNTLGEA